MSTGELEHVRAIALAMPEVSERISHGALCFFIGDKTPLCYYHDNHRGDGRVSIWCPAYPDFREELVRNQSERFFEPQTSSAGTFSTWLGVYLDLPARHPPDWKLIATILEDAYRKVAPKMLVAELEQIRRAKC